MIYTVTFNPALDYVIGVNQFKIGNVNRTSYESISFGGKGINVSCVLNHLGMKSIALGFVAGFTGREITARLQQEGIQTDFVELEEGMSRINVKLKSDEETEINGLGPVISSFKLEELFRKLDQLGSDDILVLAGSIPNTLPDNIYEHIIEKLSNRGIRVVVDATKDLLKNVLKYHPFLIKPNNHELGELFGVTLKSQEDIIHYAKELQNMGARNVLISMAGDGSILVDETGHSIRMGVPKGTVKNSVGAGDSMVAGFLAGYLSKNDYHYALRLGTACGSATAFSIGLGSKELIDVLFEQL